MAEEIVGGAQAGNTLPSGMTLAEAIAAGPGSLNTATKTPIGVPKGYLAKRTETVVGRDGDTEPGTRTRTIESTLPPRYFDGDEMQPANLPPNAIADKQRQLVDAGLLSEKDYHEEMGSWFPKTIAAYAQLLQNANATGQDESTALAIYTSAAARRGKVETKVAEPLVVHLTNPADIRALANEVATRRLGRRLSEEQLNNHVAAWQQSERQAREDEYRMTNSGLPGGTGGTVVDPARSLDEKIKNENPQEAASFDAVGRFNDFHNLLARFN